MRPNTRSNTRQSTRPNTMESKNKNKSFTKTMENFPPLSTHKNNSFIRTVKNWDKIPETIKIQLPPLTIKNGPSNGPSIAPFNDGSTAKEEELMVVPLTEMEYLFDKELKTKHKFIHRWNSTEDFWNSDVEEEEEKRGDDDDEDV